jgi:hypothetical protein
MSYGAYEDRVDFSDMMGKTITKITGAEYGSEQIVIETAEGFTYKLLHNQDCCENVAVEDVTGDISDLLGGIVCEASECSQDNPHARESGTWTFYKLNTNSWRGGVCIRWNGESNGYYSEGVTCYKTETVKEK